MNKKDCRSQGCLFLRYSYFKHTYDQLSGKRHQTLKLENVEKSNVRSQILLLSIFTTNSPNNFLGPTRIHDKVNDLWYHSQHIRQDLKRAKFYWALKDGFLWTSDECAGLDTNQPITTLKLSGHPLQKQSTSQTIGKTMQ